MNKNGKRVIESGENMVIISLAGVFGWETSVFFLFLFVSSSSQSVLV